MRQTNKLRKLNKIVAKVKKLKQQMRRLTDEELSGLTDRFKLRLERGETLDQLLPEAYAAICEADYRVLGKFPYDVQIMGAVALHQGLLAQMNTGEGKTLVATMPLYLNALTEKSTILITTNEYLAIRDAEEMGQVYRFMGLSVAAGVAADKTVRFTNDEKRAVYQSDIVYTTNGALGFDYLLNNLVKSSEERFMREFSYVIIDEADSVLLDGAQTPLVISGVPRVQSNLYQVTDFFVSTLKEERDYVKEEAQVWLTEEGIKRAETFFRVPNLYGREHFEINRHLILALRAHALFQKGKEYMISEKGELILLDGGSGRIAPGVKLNGGQHQAIEVKEKLADTQEYRSMASITYQNLFHLIPKVAGMSGTIADAAQELRDIYGIDMVVIPPNRPMKRFDYSDLYFNTTEEKIEAAIDEVLRVHQTGQPVLIVVSTIAETEFISKLLIQFKVAHNVLNANNAFWEAEMIAEAGQKDAVTVATSMAGRGTDIKLGEGVKELGGLAVIGIGRMSNVRMERQARGRSGRQGDPGFSRFYVSLEDEVVKKSIAPKYLERKRKVSSQKIRRLVTEAQKLGEEAAVFSRKQSFEYDSVLKRQREMIYVIRDRLLDGGFISKKTILDVAQRVIDDFLRKEKHPKASDLNRFLLDYISYQLTEQPGESVLKKKKALRAYLTGKAMSSLHRQELTLKNPEDYQSFVRYAMLQAIDDAWVEQVDYLQQLRVAVSGRSVAQRNPVNEYQIEAQKSFDRMQRTVYCEMLRNILLSSVSVNEQGELNVLLP